MAPLDAQRRTTSSARSRPGAIPLHGVPDGDRRYRGAADWLVAATEVVRLLAVSRDREVALQVMVDRVRELAGADVSWVVLGTRWGRLRLECVSGVAVEGPALGVETVDDCLVRDVVRSGRAVRVPDLDQRGPAARARRDLGWPVLGSAVVVPLAAGGPAHGALGLAWTPERAAVALPGTVLPAAFAEQAALALQIADAEVESTQTALLEDRDRIARDLHDVVIQRLFAVGLSLQATLGHAAHPGLPERISCAVDELDEAIRDIRRSIFALGPATDGAAQDVQSEVTRLVDRAARTLGIRPVLKFEGPVRTLVSDDLVPELLAVLGEALSNVARHARASSVVVLVSATDVLTLSVQDDGCGVGVGSSATGRGLANMRRRAALLGGTCAIRAVAGGGTLVVWTVPHDRGRRRGHGPADPLLQCSGGGP